MPRRGTLSSKFAPVLPTYLNPSKAVKLPDAPLQFSRPLPATMIYQLTDAFEVQADSKRTWEFFTRVENLPLITPSWLSFSISGAESIQIRESTQFDAQIRWLGIPVRWTTRIIDFSPPTQFIDLQIRGPYTLWHHQHRFEPCADGAGTRCFDRVIYKLPLGPFGAMAHAMMVRRQLTEIFRFRRKVIAERLGWNAAIQKDVQIVRL